MVKIWKYSKYPSVDDGKDVVYIYYGITSALNKLPFSQPGPRRHYVYMNIDSKSKTNVALFYSLEYEK